MSCYTPFGVKDKKTGNTIPVPCGKCPACYKRRISGWSFRLLQEASISQEAQFITLTYDTQYLPFSDRGAPNLDKRDVQLFFKRLRKAHDKSRSLEIHGQRSDLPPIKYFLCGEYGGETGRPHYHCILFNSLIELIQPSWDKGHVHYGEVTGASIGYTLKYMSKPQRIPAYDGDDRQKEFQLMSKGIGESYLTKAALKWHHARINERMYLNLEGNRKVAMPRYYRDKIYSKPERQAASFHQQVRIDQELREFYNDPDYYEKAREKWEDNRADFRRMYYQSTFSRNKI